MKKYEKIPNEQLSRAIDRWVHAERDRKIMKRRMIDGICFEPLAEEFQLSDRHVKRIVSRYEPVILESIESEKVPRFYCQTS